MVERTVTASELARDTAALLDAVERGAHIVVERRGRPVARLEPPVTPGRSALGGLRGRGTQAVDDDELLAPIPGWEAR